jgi:hypothetical protein
MPLPYRLQIQKRRLRRVALGLTAILGVASIYAFRAVFTRPGEDALRLLPADCLAVGSLDLNPSPEQALTFKHIDDALQRNGVKDPFQESVLDMVVHSPAVQPIRELTTRSFAVGVIPSATKEGQPEPILLMPLTDGEVANHVLHSKGVPEFWKGTPYFCMPNSKIGMMVVGNTLVVTDSPNAMHEVGEVAAGQLASIITTPAYQTARSHEPTDANLMVFGSPKIFTMLMHATTPHEPTGWMTASATVRDNGLALSMHALADPNDPNQVRVAKIAPLRSDLAQVLPAGAYGVVAISQLSKFLDAAEDGAKKHKAEKSVAEFKQKLAKETSIDAETDFEPALAGDAIIAAYPSESPVAGADLLLVVDDQNGANPAALADKFQAYVDRKAKDDKEMGTNWEVRSETADAVSYRLSDKVQGDLRKSMHGGDNDPIKWNTLFGNKTVAWAKVKGAVMLATSQDLLTKATDAYEGKGSALASQADLRKAADCSDGSQFLAAFDIVRIAQGIHNTADESKMEAGSRKMFDRAISTFSGLSAPLQWRSHYEEGGISSGSLFIPMDYEKLIDLIGSATGKQGSPAASGID